MSAHPLLRLLTAGAVIWAASRLLARNNRSSPGGKHAAIDPRDPAADRIHGAGAVRSAGPEAMRCEDDIEWDTVDQAADESFPASDPPAR
jgi:hypothetical protein